MKTKLIHFYQNYVRGIFLLTIALLILRYTIIWVMIFQFLYIFYKTIIKKEKLIAKRDSQNIIVKKRNIEINNVFQYFNFIFYEAAISIDKLGNVLYAPALNLIMVKEGGYNYGDHRDTISDATGVNEERKKLKKFGIIVGKILNLLDNGHLKKSIE